MYYGVSDQSPSVWELRPDLIGISAVGADGSRGNGNLLASSTFDPHQLLLRAEFVEALYRERSFL